MWPFGSKGQSVFGSGQREFGPIIIMAEKVNLAEDGEQLLSGS
jgi:hypothetical protein